MSTVICGVDNEVQGKCAAGNVYRLGVTQKFEKLFTILCLKSATKADVLSAVSRKMRTSALCITVKLHVSRLSRYQFQWQYDNDSSLFFRCFSRVGTHNLTSISMATAIPLKYRKN